MSPSFPLAVMVMFLVARHCNPSNAFPITIQGLSSPVTLRPATCVGRTSEIKPSHKVFGITLVGHLLLGSVVKKSLWRCVFPHGKTLLHRESRAGSSPFQ
ncbi:hypothetical protein EV126DRAFT_411513 [Verticillium dahliae]|nr:hypothetical protein EV126DRAFT_411513 [Verticillium dahliae]